MTRDDAWVVGLLIVFWMIALSYVLFPDTCSRIARKYDKWLIGQNRRRAQFMDARQLRRTGVLMAIGMMVITYLVVMTSCGRSN